MRIDNETIYIIRRVYQLTAKELGDLLGYSQTYVSRLERGLENVTDNVVDKLVSTFKLDAERLEEIRETYLKFSIR
ncbi:helix-turn-helix domain-containing protein [Oceanobacillus kimchii]|uniref:helix-turn-helix domain-containing protein n=1 Tax=Oceanobacillus kimchii TaxID=746691 RepID=UPI00232BEACD|nr:helix-turn-helix transcriptional regulator [Oceanobacillus kimchii]